MYIDNEIERLKKKYSKKCKHSKISICEFLIIQKAIRKLEQMSKELKSAQTFGCLSVKHPSAGTAARCGSRS